MPPKKKFAKFDLAAAEPAAPAFNAAAAPVFTPGSGLSFGQSARPGQKKPMLLLQYQLQIQPKKSTPKEATSSEVSSVASSTVTTPSQLTTSLTGLNKSMERLSISPLSLALEDLKNLSSLADVRKNASAVLEKVNLNPALIEEYKLHEYVSVLATNKALSQLLKEGSMILVQTLTRAFAAFPGQEAHLVRYFPICLGQLSAKEAAISKLAQTAVDMLYNAVPPCAYPSVLLQELLGYLQSSAKWKSKIGALKLIQRITDDASPEALKLKFHCTIPVLADILSDFKPELAKEGFKTLEHFVLLMEDNLDLEKKLPAIVAALSDPKKITACITLLALTTFVTEVTEAALSLLVPTLNKSLNMASSSQDQLRLTITITENLTRLVKNYREIARYIPVLLPSVRKIVDKGTLPEVRELALKSLAVLEKAEQYLNEKKDFDGLISPDKVAEMLAGLKGDHVVKLYVFDVVTDFANTLDFSGAQEFLTELKGVSGESKESLIESADVTEFIASLKKLFHVADEENIYEDEGEEIVNTVFSLAYGGRMLLNKTRLRLVKGHRYGLCGRNGAGKSTLMRAIDNGQVDGFPSKDVLKTCFVEHKVPTDDENSNNLDLVLLIQLEDDFKSISREDIAAALAEVGFDETRRSQALNLLSGGWRMKLALAKAMLMKADILLLDEPTNHLDVQNVAWLADYLLTHPDITSLIVSHDLGFLDKVCTNIIHYETKKLVYYKGNLSALVKVKPEAKSYYTLTDLVAKMAFPRCGLLQGIKSRTKAIAKMTDVTFTYPGAPKPSLLNVTCLLSLSSRVAILGPNGAGKLTLIKLLTAELIPDSGKVEKHPNLRIGYIAQHALQHVEQHKEKTANQYLQWRYKFGDDREVLMKESRKISEEEKEIMQKEIDIGDGRGPRQIEAIVGRQKYKKTFQYEVKWKWWLPKYNSWVPKETLLENGFFKLVQRFDDHEASREGLGYRELTPLVIREHFEAVGLDGDIADHTPMGSLSGGQLVKVVIAGAMWNNPHLLVLDEPTNYLDRDSLGALAVAIRDWNGGVVMISHNNEFTSALCPEQWIVENGKMVTKTIAAVNEESFEDGKKGELANKVMESAEGYKKTEDDSSPGDIKVKKRKKKLTRNEKKARDERRRLRHIEWLSSPKGTPKPVDTDDEE